MLEGEQKKKIEVYICILKHIHNIQTINLYCEDTMLLIGYNYIYIYTIPVSIRGGLVSIYRQLWNIDFIANTSYYIMYMCIR